jgi:2-polyprenyl-6-methoxyphenol hydroxylase-like FAD-dependent oxidoreductase
MRTTATRWDVLVVGAGPAGLATALSAVRHGARVLVVEKHAGTSIYPRATGVSTRSMEILRTWGIARAVRAAGMTVQPTAAANRTLADPQQRFVSLGYPFPREALAVSPTTPAVCPQDHLEPLLADEFRRLGGEIRFGTALAELHTGPDGVRAELSQGGAVRARFVVGADGHRSTVRRALGIGTETLGVIGEFVQLLFRADLDAVVGENRHGLYVIEHPDAEGVLVPMGFGRWAYARQWFPERGESPADITPERWLELVRIATGVPDLRVETIAALPFTMQAELATAFRVGAGFLVGDAAHRMTPVGGVGMNTAIADGHNLGWKLAWCARGYAGGALLHSYAQEREPIGRRNALRTVQPDAPEAPGSLAWDLGITYCSDVIADDSGERAPHRWISVGGRRMSTLDLFDGQLTLLAGSQGEGWRRAAAALPGPPLTCLVAGHDLVGDGLAEAYGIDDGGAVLVRPDGHVAWRFRTAVADRESALADAVDTALGLVPAMSALAG